MESVKVGLCVCHAGAPTAPVAAQSKPAPVPRKQKKLPKDEPARVPVQAQETLPATLVSEPMPSKNSTGGTPVKSPAPKKARATAEEPSQPKPTKQPDNVCVNLEKKLAGVLSDLSTMCMHVQCVVCPRIRGMCAVVCSVSGLHFLENFTWTTCTCG